MDHPDYNMIHPKYVLRMVKDYRFPYEIVECAIVGNQIVERHYGNYSEIDRALTVLQELSTGPVILAMSSQTVDNHTIKV